MSIVIHHPSPLSSQRHPLLQSHDECTTSKGRCLCLGQGHPCVTPRAPWQQEGGPRSGVSAGAAAAGGKNHQENRNRHRLQPGILTFQGSNGSQETGTSCLAAHPWISAAPRYSWKRTLTPSPGSALAAALEWLNLAPASSALTALVKLRALVGASKAERLCSSQGREHRELQELGLQEMELMSCLRGRFGVREEQGDKTRRAWIPEREELVLRYLPLTRIPRAFIPRSSFLIRE